MRTYIIKDANGKELAKVEGTDVDFLGDTIRIVDDRGETLYADKGNWCSVEVAE